LRIFRPFSILQKKDAKFVSGRLPLPVDTQPAGRFYRDQTHPFEAFFRIRVISLQPPFLCRLGGSLAVLELVRRFSLLETPLSTTTDSQRASLMRISNIAGLQALRLVLLVD